MQLYANIQIVIYYLNAKIILKIIWSVSCNVASQAAFDKNKNWKKKASD